MIKITVTREEIKKAFSKPEHYQTLITGRGNKEKQRKGQEMKYDDLRKQRDLTAAVSAAVGKLLICTTKTEAYETKKEIENRLFDLYSFKLKTIEEGGISKW